MINDLSDAHKKISQSGNNGRHHWENHSQGRRHDYTESKGLIQEIQDTTNKKLEKTQKELNELKKDFNKHQNETKETIKRYMKQRRLHKIWKRSWTKIWKSLEKRIQQKSWK
jgi:hypothetical protein